MKRTLLAAAVSAAPLLLLAPGQLRAQVQITSSSSTPVATATASSGAPADIDITSSGSLGITASGAAVTLNSNNNVTNAGQIGFTGIDNAVGIQVLGGFTGQVINTGGINLTETYTATDSNNDGLLDGVFAQGTNRIGIQVIGAAPFVGGITTTGPITIHGNDSEGISIAAPITGDLVMQTSTPATTSGAAATVDTGSITVLGDDTIGLQVTPTGGIGGKLRITSVSANGAGAQAVVIDGPVSGRVNITGTITATGYRSTARGSIPALALLYTPEELQQGGPAVTIGADVGGGLIVSSPTLPVTTADESHGSGQIASFGAAPALVIGAVGSNVELGLVGPQGYGFVNQGAITGDGVFDQLTSPKLPAPVSGTAIEIGVVGGGAVVIDGGIHNTGSIVGESFQGDATAMRFVAGASTPTIVNDGSIAAESSQINSATTGVVPVVVDAIHIHVGASVTSLVNNSGILASLTGTGGVGGKVEAIVDESGTLTSITNTGTIIAEANQTLTSAPMPATLTAIDISHATTAQTITQGLSASSLASTAYDNTLSYAVGAIVNFNGSVFEAVSAVGVADDPTDFPSLWRQVGATTPSISGSIYFGNGGSTLDVTGGTVSAPTLQLGTGANTIIVAGASGAGVTGATVTGAIQEGPLQGGGNHTLTISVDNGTLSDTNPNPILAKSVTVGANGDLLIAADPVHGTNTDFITTGASVFTQGAQIGLTLASLPASLSQTFTILQTVPGQGTLSAGTFTSGTTANAPFLFNVSAVAAPAANPATGASTIQLTITRKTTAELGFNNAEASALNAVLAALNNTPSIEQVVLAQTTEAGLKGAYDQLLPDQGQGLFEALDAAAEAVSDLTSTNPNGGSAPPPGPSLWLQEVNERVNRSGLETVGSNTKLLGLVGGYERPAAGGALGLSLAYFNDQEQDTAAAVGEHVVASMVEAGAYYRRTAGPITIAVRGAVGYSWFSSIRRFVAPGVVENASSNWGGLFADAHAQVSYEHHFGRYYAGPELTADYLMLQEGAHDETGADTGFNLAVASRHSSQASGRAVMVLGTQFGRDSWLRAEIRGGYREIFAGEIGDTTATFQGGTPFTLAPDQESGGWATVGFSLKSGSPYSYVALEGDADFRDGEQRYDILVAGRSLF